MEVDNLALGDIDNAPRKLEKQNTQRKDSQHVVASAFAFLPKQKRQRQNNTYTQTQREYMRKLPLSAILVACWMNAKKPITKALILPPCTLSLIFPALAKIIPAKLTATTNQRKSAPKRRCFAAIPCAFPYASL